jgi:hypothetical protein
MSSEDGMSPEVQRIIEEAQAMMTEEVFEETLRTQADVEPNDLTTLLNLVAMGLTNGMWRNSCVENWHAEGRLSDGDMMRINSYTTDSVRRRLSGWLIELGIAEAESGALAEVDIDHVDVLAGRLFRWFTNPQRRLPTGVTLGELARSKEGLEEYEEHADRGLGSFTGQMEERGVRFGLLRTACHGALACSTWWAHPAWPERVKGFIAVLDRPGDPHWGLSGEWRKKLSSEPSSVQDRRSLHTLLLQSPWKLDDRAAQWVTDAGIGYFTSTAASG